jgi:hypothetical protein
VHGWAVEEFLKTQLKNRRAYARKQGFLQDIANMDNQESDDDEDIEDDSENAGAEDENENDEVDNYDGGNGSGEN